MGDFNRMLGKEGRSFYPFVVGGKTYQLSAPTQGIKAAYETWLENQQLLTAEKRMRERLPDEEYADLLARINERIGNRDYAWGGKAWARSTRTPGGLAQLLFLCLVDQHKDVTPELVMQWFHTHTKEMAAAIERLTDTIRGEQSDPNAKAPASQPPRVGGADPGQGSISDASAAP